MNTTTALPDKMKALGEQLTLDHRKMSIVVRGRHPDRRRPRSSRSKSAVAARRRQAADLDQPSRSVSAAAGLYFPPMADDVDSGQVARPRFSTCSTRRTSRVAEQFPGDSPARQPVHIVYGGAHLFKADAAQKLGAVALRDAAGARARRGDARRGARSRSRARRPHLPARRRQADARAGRGFPDRLRGRLRQPARSPRRTSTRSATAAEVAAGIEDGTLPPSIGIRIKPLSEELKRRSLRTVRSLPDHAARAQRRHAAAELRRHAAEDHGARAGHGAGVGVRRLRVLARHRRPGAEVRADDRDDAVGVRRRRHASRCRA